ncbi:hypothetical protein NC652_041712 [Populus alba x Populus x berolinensis]|nr:hypothetical protein NC652_041712 [Populus alba x Populus x berolinensis]
MCPLRLILVFLSATLAGFFVIKNLKSRPFSASTDTGDDDNSTITTDSNRNYPHPSDSSSRFSKVCNSYPCSVSISGFSYFG